MRQLTSMTNENLAQRFADYLLTLRIPTQLREENGQIELWVQEEDQLPQARQELEAFLANPSDARYDQAGRAAQALRQQEARLEKEYQDRQNRFMELMARSNLGARSIVTMLLILASVLATLASNFGAKESDTVQQALSIAPFQRDDRLIYWNGLEALRSGQVWRAVTPIFLHFDLLHLLFNMFWLYELGGAVERSRGWWKYLLLVVLIAIGSNLAEYHVHLTLSRSPWLDFHPNPLFGGMSGVVYGLFGYVWMKSRYEPELELTMPDFTVILFLIWFVVCLLGIVGPVANVAHGVGLLIGLGLGVVPTLWRSLLHQLRGIR